MVRIYTWYPDNFTFLGFGISDLNWQITWEQKQALIKFFLKVSLRPKIAAQELLLLCLSKDTLNWEPLSPIQLCLLADTSTECHHSVLIGSQTWGKQHYDKDRLESSKNKENIYFHI